MGAQGGVMRLKLLLTSAISLATLIGLGGASASADVPTGAGGPVSHNVTVQSGDSLTTIAQTNATTYVRIYDANTNINNPDLIYPDQVIRIPANSEQLADRALPSDAPVATVAPTPAPVTNDQVVAPAPVAPAVVATPVAYTGGGSVWTSLANCESSGNWAIDTGNGFYGGLQFTLSSWEAVGGSGYPNNASPSEQIARAEILQSRQGWGAWPACSAKLGL